MKKFEIIDEYLKDTHTILITQNDFEKMKNIISKYKKIQEIMIHWVGTQCVEVDLQTLFKIREIIEDENNK